MKRFFIFLLFVSAALFPAVCPAAAADPVVISAAFASESSVCRFSRRPSGMHAQQRKLGTETLPFRRTGLSGRRCQGMQAGCKTCRPAKKPKNWRCCFTAMIGERMPFTVRATTGCLNKSAYLRHMIIFTFGWQTKRPTAKAVTSACLPTKAPFPTMPVATARGMFLPASD